MSSTDGQSLRHHSVSRPKVALIAALSILILLVSAAIIGFVGKRASSAGDAGTAASAGTALGEFSPGAEPLLTEPTGIAAAGGRVYVADAGARAILVFDMSGKHLFSFNWIKDGTNYSLQAPARVAISPTGEVFVSDRRLHALYIFDADGHFRWKFPAPYPSWSPLGIAFDEVGNLYTTDVGDARRHRVIVFDSHDRERLEFGRTKEVTNAEDDPGAFYYPSSVAVRNGSIFVSDSNNARVQVFDMSGHFQYLIPTGGISRGLAFDKRGNLMVADVLGNKIDVYRPTGQKLRSIGARGSGPGQLQFPNDVAVDETGRLLVADRGNASVQVLGLASGAGASTLVARVVGLVALPVALSLVAILVVFVVFAGLGRGTLREVED